MWDFSNYSFFWKYLMIIKIYMIYCLYFFSCVGFFVKKYENGRLFKDSRGIFIFKIK